ncbi:MAG: outer membrane protein assembly factor BamA [Pseudomonadota bacterium]
MISKLIWGSFLSVLCVLLLNTNLVLAAQSNLIRKVEYSGNVRVPAETISSRISTKPGSYLDRHLIKQDIKSLYGIGQFEDIKVGKEKFEDGLKIIFIFVEKPVIAEIGFEGNKKIKKDDLQEKIKVRTYTPLNEKELASSMEQIREVYAKKGYYLAQVSYHTEPLGEGEAKLIFDIKENQGAIVRRVDFLGNKIFSDDKLRGVVRTKKKGVFSFITSSGKFNEEQLKQDAMMLTFHYLNHGYLKVKVVPAIVSITKDKRYIFIGFQISEGEQYRIGNLTIDGDILTTKEELLAMMETKSGDIYSQLKLEQDIQRLSDFYGDEGYAYANIVPITVPNDETLTADINIAIEKGKRIKIERINIYGNTVTRDKVIRREIMVKENDRYNERLLRESRQKIMQLGFFEEVNFATPRGSRDDTIVLNVTVKERSTGSFNIGAGFSSVEHFILTASVQKDNFFGYGISGGVSAELSKKRQMFSLSVKDPYFLDTEWIVGSQLYRNAYHYTDFRRVAMGGDISLGHRFFDNWVGEIGYRLEDVKISDFSYAVPQMFRQNASGLTSAITLTMAYDKRDNRITPREGYYLNYSNEASGSKLGGDNDFYRTNVRAIWYRPLYKKKLVFKQYGRLGYIKSLGDDSVPLFERFFLGGPYSMRGFDPAEVGPTIRIPRSASGAESEFVYGGDKLLLFISELECWLYEPAGISAVVFFDAGNAFAEQENYSVTNLRMDYGFGLRWNSPMGPMRFEWGFPIDRRSNERSVVFNFAIGNVF